VPAKRISALAREPETTSQLKRERLSRSYRPSRVRILFVGESPPASGRFFYQADSGLYRAIREAFVSAFPALDPRDFLQSFRDLGCYLVDLCPTPIDHLSSASRKKAHRSGELQLSKTIRKLRPRILIILLRSIVPNVQCAAQSANWSGQTVTFAYPGRWFHHRAAFVRRMAPILRKNLHL
jgi:hypothetical protein